MGKHSAPAAESFWKKNKRALSLIPSVLCVIIGIVMTIVFFSANPYASLLEDAGVAFTECEGDEETLSLTFEGDAEGILHCRKALNILRNSENTPETLIWTLTKENEILTQGNVEQVAFLLPPSSPRVETLEKDLTLLKLKYELEQSGLTVSMSCTRESQKGKFLTVTVEGAPEDAKNALTIIPAAIQAVNEEGGGILQYTILFSDYGTLFAAASYDLSYGDVLLSSQFAE